MDEAGEKLKRAFTGAFALLFAVIVLCAVFCNQNVFGTQSPRSLLAGGLALAVGVLCAAWLLRLLPATGRTHQLRVHLAAIGHPLAGDWLYGTKDRALIARPALHSYILHLRQPLSGADITVTAPIPEDMTRLIQKEAL